jgi:hypothetical protein
MVMSDVNDDIMDIWFCNVARRKAAAGKGRMLCYLEYMLNSRPPSGLPTSQKSAFWKKARKNFD